jgi:hypothetical protein
MLYDSDSDTSAGDARSDEESDATISSDDEFMQESFDYHPVQGPIMYRPGSPRLYSFRPQFDARNDLVAILRSGPERNFWANNETVNHFFIYLERNSVDLVELVAEVSTPNTAVEGANHLAALVGGFRADSAAYLDYTG